MIFLAVLGIVALLAVVAFAGASIVLGPDASLAAPWDPASPPDYSRRPCSDRTCRIDHRAVNPWVEPRSR